MDFNNYNPNGRYQVNSNSFMKRGPETFRSYFVDNETMTHNKAADETIGETELGKYDRLQKCLSGKTYCVDSETVTNNNIQEFTQTPGTFGNYQKNTSLDIPNFNINSSTQASKTKYQFAKNQHVPCSSKEQKISTPYHTHVPLERINSCEVKSVLTDNSLHIKNNHLGKSTEKSTYCRPVTHFYNQEFVYRTLAKNARLQTLVRQLMLVRQKQKEEDLWNNYINDLKNRHGTLYSSEHHDTPIHNLEEITAERIEDYYDTRFRSRQSDPCQNLLDDFYGAYNNFNRNVHFESEDENYQSEVENCQQYVYGNQSLCYPTASQGRLIMLNKQKRQKKQFSPENPPPMRYYRGHTIYVDKDPIISKRYRNVRKLQPTKSTNTIESQNSKISLRNRSMQTDLKCFFPINENENEDNRIGSAKERYKQVAKNVERLKRKLEKSNSEVRQNAIDNIENKLNSLIQTLNTFMVDIKTNTPFSQENKSLLLSNGVGNNDLNELNAAKSDTFGIVKREEAICREAHQNTSATLTFECSSAKQAKDHFNKIDQILTEEMEKSNKFKKDIEDIMYKRTHCPRAVQITSDIPTKERATEVTRSLSKTKVVEHVPITDQTLKRNNERRIAMAVNTDPLGLYGLLRISSEAVKQILSYMPHIDYYSYLSMLQFPQTRNGIQHFVCNICGATFQRPSQLSDHIQTHNLGYSRDCCVCRHVLDMKKRRPGFFKCKYCGQRFTRAYCCELHEETCARRLGVHHDQHSGLNLLQ